MTPTPRTIDCKETLLRAATITRHEEGESGRTLELSFSSEEPVERWFGIEVLDHADGAADLSRLNDAGPLLVDHRNTEESLVGVVESARIDAKVGRATVRLFEGDERADRVFNKIAQGGLRNVSVGYVIHRLSLVEESDNAPPVYRATAWEPLEISLVPVPADKTVGVGRAIAPYTIEVDAPAPTPEPEPRAADANTDADSEPSSDAAPTATKETKPMEKQTIDINAAREEARQGELARIRAIQAAAEHYPQLADYCRQATNEGTSIEDFNAECMMRLAEKKPLPSPDIGLTDTETREFSFCRLILASDPKASAATRAAAAFELEACAAAADRLARTGLKPRGTVIPPEVLKDDMTAGLRLAAQNGRLPHAVRAAMSGRRDLSAGTSGDGPELVATNLLAGSFIDVLRNMSVVMSAGATMLTDLQGDVAIPRKTTGSTAAWISSEGGNASESDPQFDQVTLSPSTLGVATDYTRNLLLQASLDVEAMVRMDQAAGMATAIDLAALYGSGSSGQPTGVSATSGINAPTDFAGADPTYAEIVAMESAVGTDNAIRSSGMAYVTDAAMRGAFKTTEKASGTAQFIWEMGGTVNGYPCWVTEQVTDGDVFFGYWPDLLIGMWGGLDVLVDPYTASLAGTIRIVSHQSVDIAVRHPVSFAFNNDGA